MTSTGSGPGSAEVDAAVARWAAAAGVPVSVAEGYRSRTPVAVRLLRGVLLGFAVGLPLLALASVDEPVDGLGVALVVVAFWLGTRTLRRRRSCRAGS